MEKQYKDPRRLPQVIEEISKTGEDDLNIISAFDSEFVNLINIQKCDDSELFVIQNISAFSDGDVNIARVYVKMNGLIQIRDYINQLIK